MKRIVLVAIALLVLLCVRSAADWDESPFSVHVQSAEIGSGLTLYRVKDIELERVCYILDGYGKAGISCLSASDWERAYLPVANAP